MITAVVCSDDRMRYVCKSLHMEMEIIAIDEDSDFLTLPRLDAIILPVKGIDDEGYMKLYDSLVHVPSMFWQIQKDMIIFSGMETSYISALPMKKYYYMKDTTVIDENAILTAEGILHLLITSLAKSLYDIQIDIIGYGHCGKAIYRMLKSLDVKVRVIRRDCIEDDTFMTIKHWKQCGDVIINTSIEKLMDADLMRSWKNAPLIIDIATPDVVDKQCAKELGIPYQKEGNLPGRFCAESAGKIIADYVRGKLIK
ncbi:hypothetical protein [Absiella sp. AM10-20]|uniref:hypothetical protein n=1 Tax=Absiella sp. AM10-20 TaxID=2291995 RepID=UPI000E427E7F|nr:hypothetical protein [Absiella sp. AM10-20]RGB59422.1 hypothetical protein DW120_11710 [Absiella sp. AM10-20]